MSAGALLVSLSVALVAVAYIGRPFRVARTGDDLDQVIEAWVAQVREVAAGDDVPEVSQEASGRTQVEKADLILFCRQCGRGVGPDDRFCAGCGARLRRGAE